MQIASSGGSLRLGSELFTGSRLPFEKSSGRFRQLFLTLVSGRAVGHVVGWLVGQALSAQCCSTLTRLARGEQTWNPHITCLWWRHMLSHVHASRTPDAFGRGRVSGGRSGGRAVGQGGRSGVVARALGRAVWWAGSGAVWRLVSEAVGRWMADS